MTAPDWYRRMTAAAVLLVASIAAVVSYQHVLTLAERYGQPRLAAWLLPISIDGLVAASSLVLLRSARANVTAPWLARVALVAGVGATLGCNVAYGLPRGPFSAALSGWPAISFVLAAELAISMTRQRPAAARKTAADTADNRDRATQAATPRPARGRHGRTIALPARPTPADIQGVLPMIDPPVTGAKLGAAVGRSERSGRRYLELAGQSAGD